MAALTSALDEEQRASTVVNIRVLADHGDGALFFACVLWCEALCRIVCNHQGIDPRRATAPQVRLEFWDMDGRRFEPEDEPGMRASSVWSARFVAAVMASDMTMVSALFEACRRKADFVDTYVVDLLGTVSRAIRGGEA